jgi:hypothetical protein
MADSSRDTLYSAAYITKLKISIHNIKNILQKLPPQRITRDINLRQTSNDILLSYDNGNPFSKIIMLLSWEKNNLSP